MMNRVAFLFANLFPKKRAVAPAASAQLNWKSGSKKVMAGEGLTHANSQSQSVQSVGRRYLLAIYRSCAAGYDGRAAETVSKPHFMVAADVSRLTILGISYEIGADSSRFAGLLQF
jgi:hypothetical protein